MTNPEDIIGDIIVKEGGAVVTNDPYDAGGRTQYGISERSNPTAWADGVVTEAEARAIYETKYLIKTNIIKIKDKQLQAQLLDYTVNSGPFIAIMKLQLILGVDADGVLGPITLTALDATLLKDINNRLVAERIKMIGRIVSKNLTQVKYLNGWIDRALQWLS